jgi:hypothetical protein
MASTGGKSIMGNIGIKINGEWLDLMSAFVPCQLCNEPVQIRDLAQSMDNKEQLLTFSILALFIGGVAMGLMLHG